MTILEKISDNVRRYPERIAFHHETGGIRESSGDITWQELGRQSDSLACYLDRNLKTKAPVIVYGHKSPYMIISFLACVKSGRAYCPVDSSVPASRVRAILKSVSPEIVLAVEALDCNIQNVMQLEDIKTASQQKSAVIDKECYVKADDVFYIIFTSGSTGNPKGVQITRECLDNFIKWGVTLGSGIDCRIHQVFINQAPFSFDLSVMDIYLSLYTGGTIWALDKALFSDMRELESALFRSDASVWVSTPSFANICLMDKKINEENLTNMKRFLFCGEVLPNSTVDRLRKAFPGAEIINLYGPTESTVAVTAVSVSDAMNKEVVPLPVGYAKPGTYITIEDEDGNVLSDGEQGEIIITGDSVSIGYWKQPEQTKRSFMEREADGKRYRAYHTGDAGYLKEGLLYYTGRIDLQIKLHGYRIEIEDIENNLRKIKNVQDVCVLVNYRKGDISSLTACIVYQEEIEDEFEMAQAIRAEAAEYLPQYMIPKKIVFIDAMPVTGNGKTVRRALEKMEGMDP